MKNHRKIQNKLQNLLKNTSTKPTKYSKPNVISTVDSLQSANLPVEFPVSPVVRGSKSFHNNDDDDDPNRHK